MCLGIEEGENQWEWTYAVEDHERGFFEGGIEFCFAGFGEKMLA